MPTIKGTKFSEEHKRRMIIGIHQPNFLPFLGYFYKMAKCNTFVLLDNVQYPKNLYTNRAMIKTLQGKLWLTLPIKRAFPQLIKDVELVDYPKEREKHIRAIELNYKKAKYFNYLFPELKEVLKKNWTHLSELNIELIKLFKNKLGIKTKLEVASDYDFKGNSTELLIEICKKFGADTYLSGKGGAKYQEEDKFKEAGIKLEYTDFTCPIYSQLWGDFIPNLSVVDYIFNNGNKL